MDRKRRERERARKKNPSPSNSSSRENESVTVSHADRSEGSDAHTGGSRDVSWIASDVSVRPAISSRDGWSRKNHSIPSPCVEDVTRSVSFSFYRFMENRTTQSLVCARCTEPSLLLYGKCQRDPCNARHKVGAPRLARTCNDRIFEHNGIERILEHLMMTYRFTSKSGILKCVSEDEDMVFASEGLREAKGSCRKAGQWTI